MRKHTSLNHDQSRVAVSVVLAKLHRLLGSATCPPVDTLLNLVSRPVPTPHSALESSLDARRLNAALLELTKCKDDQQQRSWALYEDQSIISEYLEEIASILVRDQYYGSLNLFVLHGYFLNFVLFFCRQMLTLTSAGMSYQVISTST